MLCPDIWNLPELKYNCEINRINENACCKRISSGNFTEFITVVIPGDYPSPESVEKVLLGSDSYIVRRLPLTELLQPEFIEAFVKRGSFYALSVSQSKESECCVTITPSGLLNIAVNKDTYELISLSGKPIQTSRKSKDRYGEY
ncbi:hypothetical protein DMENIID0001_132450 [Sergentomyia squamirostris]